MIDPRTVSDVVGSTVASVAQFCAREILKRCEQVRTSRTVGEFVVNSGVSAVKQRLVTTVAPPAPDAPADDGPRAESRGPDDVSAPPVADYDLFTSAQVVELLGTLDLGTVRAVLDYEMVHRRRRLVVEAAQRLLAT